MNQKKIAQELIDFTYSSPTAYHAVSNVSSMLLKNDFQQLFFEDVWTLQKGEKYFVTKNRSALIAFVVGENIADSGFRIAGSHTDSPAIKIKPNPELLTEGFLKLNTEVYGGPILNTWFDRPLAVAGRVILKSDDVFNPITMLLNINKPLMIIPNLAIHMNREINSGVNINNQKELLPIIQTVKNSFEKENFLLKIIAENLKVNIYDILDFDLFLYEYDKGSIVGIDNEFISASRLDNLEAFNAGINALICADHNPSVTHVVAGFDNEEVGSSTKQGADSQLLSTLLERIVISLNGGREDFFRALSNSFMISTDGAHAFHPNRGEKCDITNKPIINKGPVIKISSNQKYTSDADSIAVCKLILEKAKVPYQEFVNHSNEKGGSTIGPLSSRHLEIRSVDLGVAFLAMHSIRELIGVEDHCYMVKLLKALYEA